MNGKVNYPENTVANPSLIFTSALIEDYNHEMDWLWVATKVTRVDERAYCLRRALYITPGSHRVRRAMDDLLHERRRRMRSASTQKPFFRRLMDFFVSKGFWQETNAYGLTDLAN